MSQSRAGDSGNRLADRAGACVDFVTTPLWAEKCHTGREWLLIRCESEEIGMPGSGGWRAGQGTPPGRREVAPRPEGDVSTHVVYYQHVPSATSGCDG